MYMLQDGMVYIAPSIASRLTSRYAACILLSLESQGFELTVRGAGHRHQAVAIRPLLERSLQADSMLCSLQIYPTHPLFRRFRAIANPGFMALPRDVFGDMQEKLLKAWRGRVKVEAAYELFDGLIDRALPHLPLGKRNDPRIERALQVLRVNPTYPLTELAPKLQISSDHLSRLFAQVVGLPWRSYMLWQKVRTAAFLIGKGYKLTDVAIRAGFVDSAHLSKTWQQAFGASPSYFFHSDSVEITTDPHLLEANYLDMDDQALGLAKHGVCQHCGAPLKE
jgi:AraC-like DNA-binding protein